MTPGPPLVGSTSSGTQPTTSFPSPPTLAPVPPGYPPPPYPLQYPHFYTAPCKCVTANQIRYYNHRDREYYYHNALPMTTLSPGDDEVDPGAGAHSTSSPVHYPYPQFYDPYGPYAPPMGPLPPNFSGGAHHSPYYYQESGICELILVILALALWLYSFYRLWLVWQSTLNFSESSIQGPQGWDLLVTWVVERIRIKKLRVLGMSTRRRKAVVATSEPASSARNDQIELVETNIDLGSAMNDDFEASKHRQADCVSIDMTGTTEVIQVKSAAVEEHQSEMSSSVDLNLVTSRGQLRQYLASFHSDTSSNPALNLSQEQEVP